jgi:hypothetical protein
MANKNTDVYIYLAKRDKSSVKILFICRGLPIIASRLEDVDALSLPAEISGELKQKIYDDRIYWEPWIQSADTFADFRAALKVRSYNNIPLSSQPEIYSVTAQSNANTKSLPQKTTMIRKGT